MKRNKKTRDERKSPNGMKREEEDEQDRRMRFSQEHQWQEAEVGDEDGSQGRRRDGRKRRADGQRSTDGGTREGKRGR